ncbi:peptidylprolyl isomerase [bacterium]|nr:peptidylprolyl isomerase [bacterium]
MLRLLRKKTKVVLWIVIVAFVGTIFLVWGMKTYQSSSEPMIASINDTEISPAEFNSLYQQYLDIYQNLYKVSLNKDMLLKLEKTIVENIIHNHILLNEAHQQGIKVSDQEIIDQIKKSFVDKEGKFDVNFYNNYIKNAPAAWWHSQELRIKNSLTIQKLEELIKEQVKVSPKELFDFYQKEYVRASLYHILIDPKKCLTEEMINTYYTKNKHKFTKPLQIRASHILIKLSPKASKIENQKAKEKITKILEMIKKGEDFSKLAKEYSACPSKDKGGDLGYFSRETMVPEFEEVAFALKLNQVSDIVKTKFGYHIIKLTEKKEKEYKSLSEAREEIIKLLSKEADKIANKKALSIWQELQNKKVNFKDIARRYSHAPSQKEGGYLGIIPKNLASANFEPNKMVKLKEEIIQGWEIDPAFMKVAFTLKEDSISKTVKSSLGYHIIKLERLILPSQEDFKKEKENIKSRFLTEKKDTLFDGWYQEVKSRYKVVVNSKFKR